MQKTVFVYEDTDAFREGYKQALEEEGWEVQAEESADSALAVFGNGQEFDLYVLDLLEPDGETERPRGLELLRKLEPKQSRRRVIMITGTDEIHYADRASELGAWSFIVKPKLGNVNERVRHTCERLKDKAKEAAIAVEERRACRLAERLWTQLTSPEIPRLPGLAAVRELCQMYRRFGGDFCWTKANEAKDTLTVLLGDITDKGPAAGLVALLGLASLQMAGGAQQTADQLADLLLAANENWARLTGGLKPVEEYRIAASVLHLRRKNKYWVATAACCGAPPLVLISANGGAELLKSGCTWLGVAEDLAPAADQRVLRAGDTVVLMTDGLHASGNPSLRGMTEEQWSAQLARIVRQHGDDLQAMAREILRTFTAGPPTDDRSVVLIRCEGDAAVGKGEPR